MKVLFLPDPAVFDPADQGQVDAVLTGNGSARSLVGSYLKRYFSGNFHAALVQVVVFSCRKVARAIPRMASLLSAVSHVASRSTHEKMVRAHAGRIVTMVADQHSSRDRAVGLEPGDSMSQIQPARVDHIELAVPMEISVPSPEPARFGFPDLWPESSIRRVFFNHSVIV